MTDAPSFRDTLVLVPNDGMGHADPDLGRRLFVKWAELCLENRTPPGVLAFYTRGVHLACEGSPALAAIRALEAAGTRVVLCRTCLEAFGLLDRVACGVVGGMGDILTAQVMARKVVTL